MAPILIVGATRGLGACLAKQYAAQQGSQVFGTARSEECPQEFPSSVKWVTGIDLTDGQVGSKLAKSLEGSEPLGTVIITAGYFVTEDFSAEKGPDWAAQQRMYTTSSVAPVFLVHQLAHAGLLGAGSKVVLVSSEAGSIGLRHEKEGGGNYAHHASKAALNMVGKLLSLDLREREVVVSIVHPGFMRTEMTKGVGYDKYWDAGGAVTPDEAATTLVQWVDKLDMSKTGQFWAPRGAADIGTAEATMGSNLPTSTPVELPW